MTTTSEGESVMPEPAALDTRIDGEAAPVPLELDVMTGPHDVTAMSDGSDALDNIAVDTVAVDIEDDVIEPSVTDPALVESPAPDESIASAAAPSDDVTPPVAADATPSPIGKKRLGELLVERGLIDAHQLERALAHQHTWGTRLGTALVARGDVSEGALTRVLSESLGIPLVDLARVVVDPRAQKLVSRKQCEEHEVFPVAISEHNGRRHLLLAMADPLSSNIVDDIVRVHDVIVRPAIAPSSTLQAVIKRHYHGQHVDIAPFSAGLESRSSDSTPPQFTRPRPLSSSSALGVDGEPLPADSFGLPGAVDVERIEQLERQLHALLRVLGRRGLVSKAELLHELRQSEGDDDVR
jgi:hypothetical protein